MSQPAHPHHHASIPGSDRCSPFDPNTGASTRAASPRAPQATLSPELTGKKTQARQLLQNAQLLNALPLYEELAKAAPDDAEIQFGLAFSLYSKAKNDSSASEAQALLDRSRQAANKAQQLGYKSDLFTMLLSSLKDPNLPAKLSENEDANQKMKEGEAAFGRGDNDAAIAAYYAALKLDPKLYSAALFAGDACFRKHDIGCSSEWFSKAITIDTNIETAHRYWGDALLAAGKPDEARDQYIEAIIAGPYVKQTWNSLVNWGKKTNVPVSSIQLSRPPIGEDAKTITVDSSNIDHPGTGRDAWLTYQMVRTAWRMKTFAERYPKEPTYRHTLEEENAALSGVVDAIDPKKATNLDPQLANLEKLKKDGMISCWIVLNGADEGIAQDFPAYRDAHRDLLQRYLRTYIIHEKTTN